MESRAAELPLSDKLFAWFEGNKKPATIAAVVIAVVGLVAWLVVYESEEKATTASNALSAVYVSQLLGANGPQDNPEPYLKVAEQHPGSAAAAQALLLAAGDLFTQGRYAEAQTQFEKFVREHRDSPLMGTALLGVASSLDAQGKTEQAITAYKDLISHHPSESVIPQAKFSLATLYEAQNKPELARDLFTEVERDERMSTLGIEAGMRVEDLITKYPKLAPAPVTPSVPFSTLTNARPAAPTLSPATNKPAR